MNTYYFTVQFVQEGDNEQEAWEEGIRGLEQRGPDPAEWEIAPEDQ